MKRVAEYKIVFCIITGLILTLPAMAQSLTGVSTVAEAVSSSEYSLERLTGTDELRTTKIPSIITNNGTKVMNVTIPEEALDDEGVEIIDDSPWIVKGVEDPVAEEVADRKEYLVDSIFPYGLDNGLELNSILIRTYAIEFIVGYFSLSDVMYLPDVYTGNFDDGEVDDFLLKSIGCAIWAEVLTQEDKEEYVRIEEDSRMATVAEDALSGLIVNPSWRYREIPKSIMNKIFEDNTCWHEWVYDPESTKVQFKLDVNEETFTSYAGFQSLSEDKQKKFLERWQKAEADYKEDMLSDCKDEFGGSFWLYVNGWSIDTAKVNDSSSSLLDEWVYESTEFMANIFSRFGAEEGYTYVYDYDEDTGEITRYQAELVEIEGYLLPDNPVLDE